MRTPFLALSGSPRDEPVAAGLTPARGGKKRLWSDRHIDPAQFPGVDRISPNFFVGKA
jgi:hypothetical protein